MILLFMSATKERNDLLRSVSDLGVLFFGLLQEIPTGVAYEKLLVKLQAHELFVFFLFMVFCHREAELLKHERAK